MLCLNTLKIFYDSLFEIAKVEELTIISLSSYRDDEEDYYGVSFSRNNEPSEELLSLFILNNKDESIIEIVAASFIEFDSFTIDLTEDFETFLNNLRDNKYSSEYLANKLDSNLGIKKLRKHPKL